MDSLYLLVPIALVFCAITIKLLLWAINNGQYDDMDKEAWRILVDEETPPESEQTSSRSGPS
ncbi:MAG: cbb3-type cytochrome oxidase assembly protein CcoS [Pseudomonadota bacterium]